MDAMFLRYLYLNEDPYLLTNSSSSELVNQYVTSITKKYTTKELDEIKTLFNNNDEELKNIIKQNGILNGIRLVKNYLAMNEMNNMFGNANLGSNGGKRRKTKRRKTKRRKTKRRRN